MDLRGYFHSFLFLSLLLFGCADNSTHADPLIAMDNSKNKFTNHLIHETSPYLQQHAHNPVDWYPWNEEALAKAKKENKLMLVSIGYSACHWCHVMEHESFEDSSVARIMNEHFVCVKVDREERPDIDQVYMNAVQLMTGSGGWPLNCFAMPDGRPVYGGTYFPRDKWKSVLLSLSDMYKSEPEKLEEYAEKLTEGVRKSELVKAPGTEPEFSFDTLRKMVDGWKKRFDNVDGGPMKAPKFPLPNNYRFLLHYYSATKDRSLLDHINLTLTRMAWGGIYDQVGGGFSRYSTDSKWKAPHFEKMLYDNAQLVSLYSEAYRVTKDPLYKSVVYETIEFIRREMTSPEGAFYSALDADSEGEEGKYYVWTKDELKKILGDDLDLFSDHFNVNNNGLWEHGNYILLRNRPDAVVAKKCGSSETEFQKKIKGLKEKVLFEREKRVRPGLDDKILTSWNAMMIKGLTDAYNTFNEPGFLSMAIKNANFILDKQVKPGGGIFHNYKNGVSNINGFLEDYSFTIDAFIGLYTSTLDEKWLNEAKTLADHTIRHFADEKSGLFWFTSDQDSDLIARKMEVMDNVIPASNSSFAISLFQLGKYFYDNQYIERSRKMLHTAQSEMASYGSGYSNWGTLMLYQTSPCFEVAVVGNSVDEIRRTLFQHYLPGMIFAGSLQKGKIPMLEDRFKDGKTLIYVCREKICKAPVTEVEEALKLMH